MQTVSSFVIRFKKPLASVLLLTFTMSAAQLTSIGFSFPAPAEAAAAVWFSGQTHPWLDCGPVNPARPDRGPNCNPGGHWQDLTKDAGQPPVLLMGGLREGQTVTISDLVGKIEWGQDKTTCRDGLYPHEPKQVAIGQFTNDANQVIAVPGGGVADTNALLLKSFEGNGIKVPAGATRLYGSFPDSRYNDNNGQCDMTVNVTTPQCQDGVDNDNDGLLDFPQDPGCSESGDNDESPVNKATFSISKTVFTQGDITPGQTIQYSIKVKNTSNVRANNVTVVDNIPTGLTYNAQSTSNFCVLNGAAVNCPVPFLDPGIEQEVIVGFDIPSTVACGTTIHNQADVGGQNGESNWSKNDVKLTCAQNDLSIQKNGPATITRGTTAIYSVTVQNNGTTPVTGVWFSDDAPQGFVFNAAQSDPSCHLDATGSVSCNQTGYNPGEAKNYTLAFDVPAAASCGTTVTNRAYLSPVQNDPNNSNNESRVQSSIQCVYQCQDGIDNDGDGAADYPNDFSCSSPTDDDEANPKAQCQDGIDNDGDGLVDFPQDPGCTSNQDNDEFNQVTAQCADGIDNDSDGAADYPNDFSCSSATDNDEANPKAQCQDGTDNDSDGLVDFPQDPGCTSNQDNDESPKNVATLQITKNALSPTVNPNGIVQFSVKVRNNGSVRANNVVVNDAIPSSMSFEPTSTSNFCSQQGNTIVCPIPFLDPTIEQEVTIGLRAAQTATCNATIRNTANASADLVSQVSDDATVQVQCIPQCSDGIDNDGDGAADYPNDFSCSSATDDDEANPKAQCQDGIDNDGDGLVDFPQDPGCTSNQDNDESPQNFVADLSITKAGPATIQAGGVAVYNLTIQNAGPGTATNVTVSDLIPAGTTFNAGQSSPSCAMNNVEVLCNNLTLTSGASRTVQVAFNIPVQPGVCAPTTIFNTASVATSATDPNPSNNQSALVATSVTCPVLPQCSDGIDNDGDNLIDFPQDPGCTSNQDNDEFNQVTAQCSDGIDNDGDGAADYPNDFSCSSPTDNDETNPKAQCQDGTDNDSDGLVDFPQDPGCTSNQDNDEANIAQDADIMTSKSGPQTVLPGGTIAYTVTVKNLGPGSASQVAMSDPVPAGTTFNAALSDASCTLIGPSVNCGFYSLAQHATKTVTLVFNVPQSAACSSIIRNQAEAWAKEADPNGANNHSAEVATTVQCQVEHKNVDLSLNKTGPATVLPGGVAVYTLTATNAGPDTATNVVIADPVPAGVTFNSAQSSSNCIQNGANILCNSITLNAGQSTTVTIAFNVPMQSVNQCVPTTIFNTAAVSTSATETNPANNQSQLVSTLVQCPTPITADLSITKSGPQTALQGGLVVYTISVTNSGPSSSSGVKMTDLIPSGLTFNTAQSDASCHVVGSNVECGTFTLGAGAQKSVQLAFEVPLTMSCGSSILNTANVSAATQDPNAFNNQSQVVTTTVQCPVKTADLSITKTGPSSIQPGAVIVYTLTATNAGPDTATNVTMADPIPTGLTFNAAQSSVNCVQNGANILCDNITLASSASKTVSVAFNVPAQTSGTCPVSTIVNTASVSTSVTDPNPLNNQSQIVQTVVNCSITPTADLSITKSGPASVLSGQTLTYSLTAFNAGPNTASGVIVTDAIPSGLVFMPSASDNLCSQNGATISCHVGNLAASASRTLSIGFKVAAACNATVLNMATISSSTQDNNSGNNQSQTVQTTVQCNNQNPTFTVTKSDGRSTAAAGDTLTYTITVTNTSTVNATNVTVTDPLSSLLTFVSASDNGTLNGSTVTWSNLSIPALQSKTLTLVATVKSTAQNGEIITNMANVQGSTSGSDSTTVQNPVTTGCIDIVKLVFDSNGNSVSQMPIFTFRTGSQSVQNDTAGRARFSNLTPGNYTVTEDTLSGWTQYSVVPTGGTVTVSGGSSCSVVTFINRQQSSSSSSSSGTPTYTITKTDGVSSATVGQSLTYTITVTNTSTVNATNVTVTDVLPSQLTFTSASDAGTINGSLVTWSNLSIAAGQSKTLTLTATVQNMSYSAVLTNVAQVGSVYATDTTSVTINNQPPYIPPYVPPYQPPYQPPYVPPVTPPYTPPSTGFKPYPYQIPVTGGEGGAFFTATDSAVLMQTPSDNGSLMAYISILVTTMAGLASAAGGTALKFMTI